MTVRVMWGQIVNVKPNVYLPFSQFIKLVEAQRKPSMSMVSQVNVAPIGVLPLKVLATRDVIREKMDYKDCIGGKLREELDGLTRFEGKFVIDTSELEVLWRGEKLSEEEWQYMKSRLPACVISFLDGKQEFSVLEKTGVSGEREWDLQDEDGSSKLLQLSSRITKEIGGWEYREQFFTSSRCGRKKSTTTLEIEALSNSDSTNISEKNE